jgi:hypothetical protein
MERCFFFNSNNGDRLYDAASFASYFGKLVTNGIFYASADNLRVTAGTGMSVTVAAGAAWINGYCYENTDNFELILPIADGVNPRIDRILVRWSLINRTMNLAVQTGAPSATPAPHAIIRTGDVYELCLADILIPKSSITIIQNNITDTRANATTCGVVNSLVCGLYS